MLIKIYKPFSHKEVMKTIKMCAMLMLIVLSVGIAQATIANTDGSAIGSTPSIPTTPPTPTPTIQDTVPESSTELSAFAKSLVIGGPIIIIIIAFYILKKKKKRKKFREFDDQPKDISQKRLWKNAKMVKKPQEDNPKEVIVVDEAGSWKKPLDLSKYSEEEQLIRSATKKVKTNSNDKDEKEKARLAIEKILEEAKLRDKPGFDDPTRSGGSVTTYK